MFSHGRKKSKHLIAVALEYGKGVSVPKVSAVGERETAKMIKNTALRYGVPIAKNPGLAERLLEVAPDEEISQELYMDVASLLKSL